MPSIDYSSSVTSPAASAAPAAAKPSGFSFGDFLDIINPLQHIPVISTLYRHITGDEIGTPEKIAGDTLYGGVIGLVSSLGDIIFQAITGKDVGDTVYAYLFGNDTQTNVASKPAIVEPASAFSLVPPDLSALTTSMSNKGVDPDIARRAAYAYGRAVGLAAY
jgi:hypothetical protein